ncbi:MAG: ferrous iron transport protein [Clostridiales bacterium]|nr:ferrous iron transport protein [Clostridiales bacterium]
MKIALAGNPNSGKTTLFNAITGKTEYVGNWPGVTVEKKEANLKRKYLFGAHAVRVVDLPGVYSISPFTSEEAITRDFIMAEAPDVILNIVDGANLSRSLFLTSQLLELGVPMIIALNKEDVLGKRGDQVDVAALSKALNCSVIPTTATSQKGLLNLMEKVIELAESGKQGTAQSASKSQAVLDDISRQAMIDEVVKASVVKKRDARQLSFSDKVDRVVAHKIWGLPIFFLVMWAVYSFSISGLGGAMSAYLNDTVFGEIIPDAANGFFEGIGVSPILQSLIVNGIIGGVGAVIGFLPLIMILFFCLALLEDSGYMSRVALVMDRYFKKIGLSGKSIIPMIVGSGCSVPGVMATRTIEDVNEKRMTTILTPFVPCGAKLPIIALFSAVFFPNASWVGPSMYILAIGVIILGGLLLKKLFVWENTSYFILELPEYKVPSLKHAFIQMIDKAKAFIRKATTIILVMNTLIWFMQAYSWSLQPVQDQSMSILASVGSALAPLMIPLGIVGWQFAAAAITGFVAKENVVSTFAILLAAASEQALAVPGGPLSQLFNPVTAYAYLAFNLFSPPCFAAISAMNSEMGSKKWLFRGLGFQLSVGYLLAMVITQVGTIIVYKQFAVGFIPSIFVALGAALGVVLMIRHSEQKRLKLAEVK